MLVLVNTWQQTAVLLEEFELTLSVMLLNCDCTSKTAFQFAW